MIKRWVNEAQEAVNSDNVMVQVNVDLSFFFYYINIYFYELEAIEKWILSRMQGILRKPKKSNETIL